MSAATRLATLACLANVVFIGLWVVSRIWGLPVGPEAGHAHQASFVDITCVILEAAFVIVGYELLARPERGAGLRAPSLAALAVLPIAIVAVTAVAVTSPSASEHAHGEHDHGGETASAGAHDHGADTADGHADDAAHDHGAAEVAFLFPDGDDRGWSDVQNGEERGAHRTVPIEDLAPRVRSELERQLALTLVPVMAYPTVADAEAAGYHRTGSFNPGLGVHYTGGMSDMDGRLSDEEITHPSTITYDGTAPDSTIVGFMYNSNTFGADSAPAGFADQTTSGTPTAASASSSGPTARWTSSVTTMVSTAKRRARRGAPSSWARSRPHCCTCGPSPRTPTRWGCSPTPTPSCPAPTART